MGRFRAVSPGSGGGGTAYSFIGPLCRLPLVAAMYTFYIGQYIVVVTSWPQEALAF